MIRSSFKLCLFIFWLLILFTPAGTVFAKEIPYAYSFFTNSRMPGNYFYSYAKYSHPSWLKNIQSKIPVSPDHFHTPGNSLVLQYKNAEGGDWTAGLIKPIIRGQDKFLPASRLSFRLFILSDKTSSGQLPLVRIGKKDSSYSQPLPVGQYTEGGRGKWLSVSIPLNDFTNFSFQALTEIHSIQFSQSSAEGHEHQIFLDDIELLPPLTDQRITSSPAISRSQGFERHVDIEWARITDPAVKLVKIYRGKKGGTMYPVGVQIPMIHRYADYTGKAGEEYDYRISFLDHDYRETTTSARVSAATREMTDEELLTMVQEACFRFYWEGAEPVSGLARENIPGRLDMIATGASGFGLMALLVGVERGFISRTEAVARYRKILNFLSAAETFHGAFPHFYDGPSGKVEPFFGRRDNGGDLVETSFLVQGLLTAREYFDRSSEDEKWIRNQITQLWRKVEWSWYRRTPGNNYLLWHWSPDQQWVINHNLIGWNETMITYLLAIASPSHAIPVSMYYSGWASQDSIAQRYRMNWGETEDGSNYTNSNSYYGIELPVGVSNGGPLFFIHYSYLAADPAAITDRYTNYFENNRNIALINHRYSVENPKGVAGYSDSAWGLTASDGPFRYSADEPVPHQDHGKIAPTGAIASFPYTPDLSMKALRNYYRQYGSFLWGEYGFRDAFSLEYNWCSEIYMGLNQAPMVVMIENYRTGMIWKTFMRNQEIKNALQAVRDFPGTE